MIWLPATLLAALFQAWRTAVQARVRGELSLNAAGLVRYLYGLPVGIVLLLGYIFVTGRGMPALDVTFVAWCIAAGLAQIIGTNLLLMAFGYRNFVVGTAYAKTEAIQGAILSLVLLGEHLSVLTWMGIGVGVAGVVLLSKGDAKLRVSDLVQPAALCGLGAGLGFTLTSIFVKKATLTLDLDHKVLAALVALVIVQAGQSVMQGSWVSWREPEQWRSIFSSWRVSGQVGLLAALGSACWFTGFATAPVALVRAVGQIEVVLTIGFGHYYLKQAVKKNEIAGLIMVGIGVIFALLGAWSQF